MALLSRSSTSLARGFQSRCLASQKVTSLDSLREIMEVRATLRLGRSARVRSRSSGWNVSTSPNYGTYRWKTKRRCSVRSSACKNASKVATIWLCTWLLLSCSKLNSFSLGRWSAGRTSDRWLTSSIYSRCSRRLMRSSLACWRNVRRKSTEVA